LRHRDNHLFFSDPEARDFFETTQGASEGRFENRISFESLERLAYFEAAVRIDAISPTPLRMILAKKDFIIPAELALEHMRAPTNRSRSSS
jgi:hypothetical protein